MFLTSIMMNLVLNCPKTEISLTIFMLNPPGTKMIFYMQRWFSVIFFRRRYDENHCHIYKITFVPGCYSVKIISDLSVYRQFPSKMEMLIFRGAIIMIIYQNLNWMGTLIKKNIRFFLFQVKKLKIWNLSFRVPKKGMSGLPYLLKPWFNFRV